MLYALLMLALHPHVQETLVSEIRKTIGDRLPTYDDVSSLVYPLCIMFETMRLFPPIVGIPKNNPEGDQLLMDKYLITKDAILRLDVVHLHRNPKYWGHDAGLFNPSRFDGRNEEPGKSTREGIKFPAKGAFIPFSIGQRSCLGTIMTLND